MYQLTKEEQETTVNWCAADSTATIDTADPVVLRKLDRLAEEYPDVYKVVRVDPNYAAKMYSVPARFIRFGKPASEARKEASRKALVFSSRNVLAKGDKNPSAIADI